MPVSKTHSQQKQAYERLRWLLILQQIPPGERLREAEWAARLGVHRTSLREAFARLEAEGLIVAGASTGFLVPHIDAEHRREVNEIRCALEGLAIERICRDGRNAGPRLRDVELACEAFERCVREGAFLGAAEGDRRFHEALVDAAGSPRLSAIYRHAPLPLIHQEMADPAVWLAEEQRTLREHRAILAAIRRVDVSGAVRLLRDHLLPRGEAAGGRARAAPGRRIVRAPANERAGKASPTKRPAGSAGRRRFDANDARRPR